MSSEISEIKSVTILKNGKPSRNGRAEFIAKNPNICPDWYCWRNNLDKGVKECHECGWTFDKCDMSKQSPLDCLSCYNKNQEAKKVNEEKGKKEDEVEEHSRDSCRLQTSEPTKILFGMTKEKFLKQVEKFSDVKSSNETILFTVKKEGLKDLIRPIRKCLKYKLTESIDVDINCDKQSIKKITLYFDNPESFKQDPEKHIVIYSGKVYESKLLASGLGLRKEIKSIYKTFESSDSQLQELSKALFKHISEIVDTIFEKKKQETQHVNKKYIPLQEKFKKRLF